MNRRIRLLTWLSRRLLGEALAVSPNLRSDDPWPSRSPKAHDRSSAEIARQYDDALTAWRRNPLAWRIIQITTDYTVGEGISISSGDRHMQEFIEDFWFHPENNLHLRLESMSEELARAGDLFPVLFRQRHTGVSIIRFITKDQVSEIETKPSDWEREIYIHQDTDDPTTPKRWPTPHSPRSARSQAVCLHYSVNKPLGALFGESDLTTILPWLLRYSRMLEDRVRFHWATKMFLWFVQVPRNKVQEKSEQYRNPPDAGSIVVHDESEVWDAKSPVLRGSDAAPDLKSVRNMIDAGSGYPPHWRGEATDVNLATAQAMQEPAERHLSRRQQYFLWMLQDITFHAYERASQIQPEMWPALKETRYRYLFTSTAPDVSKADNQILARATHDLAAAFDSIRAQYPESRTLSRLLLKLLFKFTGEQQEDEVLDQIMEESAAAGETPERLSPVPALNGHGRI